MIRHLPEQNARQGFFERPEFEALAAALPEHLKDFARFAYLTGWRKGEIASLSWSDVDRDGGAIRLRPEHSKNGRGRIVPFDVLPQLTTLPERRTRARLFTGEGNVPRVSEYVFHDGGEQIGDFRKAWASACVTSNLYHIEKDPDGHDRKIPDKLFHDLRRTAVRNMVRAGVDPASCHED